MTDVKKLEKEYQEFIKTNKITSSLSPEMLFLLYKMEKIKDDVDKLKYKNNMI